MPDTLSQDLKGKAVLITGASTGIGAAAARAFARAGCRVGIHYNASLNRAEEVAADVRFNGAEAFLVGGDLRSSDKAREVVAYCTHPVLSGGAVARINNSDLDEIVVTDTIPLSPDAVASPRIRALSCAQLLAETMTRISNEESVSSLFTE